MDGLSTEGNLRFKIDWASLIVGRKYTVFALFYFIFEGNVASTSPRRAYFWRGDLTEVFLRYRFGGLIFEGAYFRIFFGIWRLRERHLLKDLPLKYVFYFLCCYQSDRVYPLCKKGKPDEELSLFPGSHLIRSGLLGSPVIHSPKSSVQSIILLY